MSLNLVAQNSHFLMLASFRVVVCVGEGWSWITCKFLAIGSIYYYVTNHTFSNSCVDIAWFNSGLE